MASILAVYAAWRLRLVGILLVVFLSACADSGKDNVSVLIPQRVENTYITDQMEIAGRALLIWSEDGGCKLQVGKSTNGKLEKKLWLKPTAPCYFMKTPGTQKTQVFQQDKVTRVIAVLGTPVSSDQLKRCGREVQGVLVNSRGKIKLSARIAAGSVYCEDKGLDNFQYSLFSRS